MKIEMANKATLRPGTVGVLIGHPRRVVCLACLDHMEECPDRSETSSRDGKICIRCECKDPAVLRDYFIERVKNDAWDRIKDLASSNSRHGAVDANLMLEPTIQVLMERVADLSIKAKEHMQLIGKLVLIVESLSGQVADLCGSGNK